MLHDTQRTSAPSIGERLDEHRRLNRHVQAAHDAGAGQRLLACVALAQRHQAGHLVLGQAHLLAAPLGQVEIGHLVRRTAGLLGGSYACISRSQQLPLLLLVNDSASLQCKSRSTAVDSYFA